MTTGNELTQFDIDAPYTVEGSGATAILIAEPLEDADLDRPTGGGSVARWNFENAWPTKTSAAKGGTDVAMEELKLASEGIEFG